MKRIFIKIWLLVFLFLLLPWGELPSLSLSVPQTKAESVNIDGQDIPYHISSGNIEEFLSPIIETPFPFDMISLRWQGDENIQFSLKVMENGRWTAWRIVDEDHDATSTETVKEGELLFTENGSAFQYRIIKPAQSTLQHVQIIYVKSEKRGTFVEQSQAAFSVQSRSMWGADESLRYLDTWQIAREAYCKKAPWVCVPLSNEALQEIQQKKADMIANYPEEMKIVQTITSEDGHELKWAKEYTAKERKIVLHHTGEDFSNGNGEDVQNENTNGDALTAEDYQARIRSIYYYHTVVRGWGDIGYNYIVDPLGNVYEGRAGGDRVIGAHVAYYNEGSVGLALMGNYNTIDLGQSSLNGVVQALIFLSKKYNLNPEQSSSFRGKVQPNVVGHRDLAATSCPGDNFYSKIPQLRYMTAVRMQRGDDLINVPIVGDANQASDRYSAQYVSNDVADVSVPPTSSKTVRFRFKNTGTETWGHTTYLSGCCSFDPTLDVVGKMQDDQHMVIASMEQQTVRPGFIADFSVTFTAGYVERVNIVNLAPVINGEIRVQSVLIPVSVVSPDYTYEYISSQYPKNRLRFGEETTAEVVLKNAGNIKWVNSGENAIVLKPDNERWRKTLFHPSDPTVMATLRESEVLPGQAGHFIFSLTAPDHAGIYNEYFSPSIKQVGYFKNKGMHFEMVVVDPAQALEYSYAVVNEKSFIILPQEEKTLSMTLKNTDTRTWTGLQNNSLLLVSWGLEGGQVQSDLHFSKDVVSPGDTVDLSFSLKAPARYGRYSFSLLPRKDGFNLFSSYISVTMFVRVPALTGKVTSVEIPSSNIDINEAVPIVLSIQNTGNVPWKRGETNVGKFYNRDKASIFFHDSWLNTLRPATLAEELVLPGEMGTFRFIVQPKKGGINEEYYSIGVQNFGWVQMSPVLIKLYVQSSSSLPSVQNNTTASLADLMKKNIRVKLSFPSSDNTTVWNSSTSATLSNGSTKITIDPSEDIVITRLSDGNFNASYKTTTIKGLSLRLTPSNNGIVTVKNWERYPSWDTNKIYNDNVFQGTMEVLSDEGALALINELPLEQYLQGVAEVPESDHSEKKKVMSILARTYALFYMSADNRKFPGKPYDASDDPDVFQKYLGYTFSQRSPLWQQALQATNRMVVLYQGQLIKTPYFNQSDGRTRSAEEVWGWKDTPYLISVPDPLCPEKILKGHGVGLSGCGAQQAAELGNTYEDIIRYYYTGVEVKKVE